MEALRSLNVYDNIFWSQENWNGLDVWHCSHTGVEEYQVKVLATLKAYLMSTVALSTRIMIFNEMHIPIQEWKFDITRKSCTSPADLSIARMRSILNSIAAAVSLLPPVQTQHFSYAVIVAANKELAVPPQCSPVSVDLNIKDCQQIKIYTTDENPSINITLSYVNTAC